jgi:ABC-type multidrug transport system fused ATPase/permease subunit
MRRITAPSDRLRRTARDVLSFLGAKGVVLFCVGAISSLLLSLVEYGIALFLMLFFFTLGFVKNTQLPSWFPVDVRTLSPLMIWGGLFVIVAAKAAGEIVTYQSRVVLAETVQARLRMVLGYRMLKQKRGHAMPPLSEVNLYMAEFFPKAISFLFHITQLVSFCIQAAAIIAGMIFLAPGNALVGIFGLGLMGIIVLRLNRLTTRASRKVPEAQSGLERWKVRVTRNWLLIKVMRLQDEEYENCLRSVFLYYRQSAIASFFGNLGGSLTPVMGVVVIALIVILNSHFFHTSSVDLVAFLYLFVRFQQRVAGVAHVAGGMAAYRVHFAGVVGLFSSLLPEELREALRPERMFRILGGGFDPSALAGEGARNGRTAGGAAATPPPSVSVRNVTFSWPPVSEPVIEDLSLEIEAGSQFGIVGPNGSGKSTLLGMILGILRPSTGAVSIAGKEADRFSKEHYESIGYVGAEPYLIYGSVRNNLTYGLKRKVSDAEILTSLRTVGLDGFVGGLPGGLGYVIQENGEGLSSGQKQRLTIARALFRNPALLVLDEPSSNLDEETEAVIVEALAGLKGRCTVIIVSHKPELLGRSDRIFDMGSLQKARAR